MKNVTVYREENVYAGWPANHGIWQWGDEILVGFMRGEFKFSHFSVHQISKPYEFVQARSLDGGETWNVETTGISDVFGWADYERGEPLDLSKEIVRCRGTFDHGGDKVADQGGYWKSKDKGKTWYGPLEFIGYDKWLFHPSNNKAQCLTTRTRTYGEYLFVSKGLTYHWGRDSVFVIQYKDGAFQFVGTVCDDDNRAVMPDVCMLDNVCYAALRRRGPKGTWVDLFSSTNMSDWQLVGKVDNAPGDNGNPPALVARDGKLFCTFGDRTKNRIVCYESSNGGQSWNMKELRTGGFSDIGYPQMVVRPDNKIVCIYYWADDENPVQHIEATIF
jgi:hypothetical protein